jgi:integrase
MTTEDRINRVILPPFRDHAPTTFSRSVLQELLDDLAKDGIGWSTIAHNEGLINGNPAALVHIPDGSRRERYVLPFQQAPVLFNALPLGERTIVKLCVIAGLRPSEALATKWADLSEKGLRITRRAFRGVIETSRTIKPTATLTKRGKTDPDQ